MSWLGDAWDWTKDTAGDVWDAGKGAAHNALQGSGLETQPASIDLKGASAPIQQKGESVYGAAMGAQAAAAAAAGPTGAGLWQNITPEKIGSPQQVGTSTIRDAPQVTGSQISGLPLVQVGQTVDPGSNATGAGAAELRDKRLAGAEAALSAPSAVKATMAAAQGKIGKQMLGAAAGARGADRASARRAAMLGIGANGIQAGSDAAAMAAQEQAARTQAYNAALGAVQQGDVSAGQLSTAAQTANLNAGLAAQGQNLNASLSAAQSNQGNTLAAQTTNLGAWTDIVKANQSTGLAASLANANLDLQRQQANQQAGILAGTANNSAGINAFNAAQGAQNGLFGTALQAGGLQNQNLGVQAGYYGNYDQVRAQQNQNATGTASALLGMGITALSRSDERIKSDISPLSNDSPSLASSYSSMLSSAFGTTDNGDSPWKGSTGGQNFLQAPTLGIPAIQKKEQGGGLGSLLGSLGGGGLSSLLPSDERTKNIDGKKSDVSAWSDEVEPITFRYKPGIEDGGAHGHIGVSAQQLERTGPIGKALVYKDEKGLRSVNYPELAFAMAVAAKERADEAWQMSKKKGAR